MGLHKNFRRSGVLTENREDLKPFIETLAPRGLCDATINKRGIGVPQGDACDGKVEETLSSNVPDHLTPQQYSH